MSSLEKYDKHDLYELCVQNPEALIPLLNAIHNNTPKVLAEDFAGTSILSHQWVQQSEQHRAIAHAQDPVMMAHAMRKACQAGHQSYKAGRIPKKRYATASSPMEGAISYIPGE